MDKYYIIGDGNRQLGPFSADDLPKYGLTPESYVWKDGMPDWTQARHIPELMYIIGKSQSTASAPPPFLVDEKPKTHMLMAILTTIFCLWPMGIVSIYYALRVDYLWDRGKYDESIRSSAKSKSWSKANIIITIILVVLCLFGSILAFSSIPEF